MKMFGYGFWVLWTLVVPFVSSVQEHVQIERKKSTIHRKLTTDFDILSQLYTDAGGSGWTSKLNWMTGTPCPSGAWYGISCTSDAVVKFDLAGISMIGTLPSQLGLLSALTFADSRRNSLTGLIPSEVGILSLIHFRIGENSHSGLIPSELGMLSQTTIFGIYTNDLTGTLPSEIGQITSVSTTFRLNANLLTGSIPSQLGMFSLLANGFRISENNFCGDVPSQVAALSSQVTTYSVIASTGIGTACPTPTPTLAPTQPSPQPTPVPTDIPIPSPTKVPIPQPTSLPTQVPIPQPTSVPTSDPTSSPTPIPFATPSMVPIPSPSAFPSLVPISAPTLVPVPQPSETPSMLPTTRPSLVPSPMPTSLPTNVPSFLPSPTPTPLPTPLPTPVPTIIPTPQPTPLPTPLPTQVPTIVPTPQPTLPPSPSPTPVPTTSFPSSVPTIRPTTTPTIIFDPTIIPSPSPTQGVYLVEVASEVVFSGFNSTDSWTEDVETGFKEALLVSLPLVESVDDIIIKNVTLTTEEEERRRRRKLLATTYLTIDYVLSITDGASSLEELVASIEKEMVEAFNTTAFETNLDTYGGDSFVNIDFDAEATLTIVDEGVVVTYSITIVRTKSPSHVPTMIPTISKPSNKDDGNVTVLIGAASAGLFLFICFGGILMRYYYFKNNDGASSNKSFKFNGGDDIENVYSMQSGANALERLSASHGKDSADFQRKTTVDFGGTQLSGAYHIPRSALTLEDKPFARGGGGQIFKGRYRANKIAAKQVFSSMDGDNGNMEEFERETAMLVGLSHPNVLALFGTTMDKDGSLYQILEYCDGGDLQGYYQSKEFDLLEFKRVGMELLGGVAYLHERLIVHRDLKPENVLLLGDTKRLKIADFGLAKANRNAQMTIGVGTPAYMPPEMFDDSDEGSNKSMTPLDVYAIGIILAQLWTKRAPWKGKTPHKVMSFILKGKRPPFDGFRDGLPIIPPPIELKTLIEECWSSVPEDRPQMDDIFSRFEKDVLPAIDLIVPKTPRRSLLPDMLSNVVSTLSPKRLSTTNNDKSADDGILLNNLSGGGASELNRYSTYDDTSFSDDNLRDSEITMVAKHGRKGSGGGGGLGNRSRDLLDPNDVGMSQMENRKLKRTSDVTSSSDYVITSPSSDSVNKKVITPTNKVGNNLERQPSFTRTISQDVYDLKLGMSI